jgi:hypothetical protein
MKCIIQECVLLLELCKYKNKMKPWKFIGENKMKPWKFIGENFYETKNKNK